MISSCRFVFFNPFRSKATQKLNFRQSRYNQSSPIDDPPKPNLREASRSEYNRKKNIAIACIILASIYMYPTILKPLLGLKDKQKAPRKSLGK